MSSERIEQQKRQKFNLVEVWTTFDERTKKIGDGTNEQRVYVQLQPLIWLIILSI